MAIRMKFVIALMLVAGGMSIKWAAASPGHHWLRFMVYLAAVLLGSGMKVTMPKGDGTASVNFPIILLGVVQLSPAQAMALAAFSIFAQCRIRVLKPFSLLQIAFNVSNATVATAIACFSYAWMLERRVDLLPALSIAVVAYFIVNTIPVALVIGWSKGEKPFTLWRREFLWYLPFYLVGASLAGGTHLIGLRFGWTTSLLIVPVVYTIYRAYRSQITMAQERQVHLEETEALHLRTIEGLAMAIEAKDQNTHDHLLRVRVYVSEIGRQMGLDDLEMKALLTASLLHDIGKLAVPEHIVNKPGKLTPEEFEKMKIHPGVGADMLERVRFPYPVVPVVRWHHEAWDGTGYPDGLRGEEIPIGARILAVVDCFDALASDRPYRKAMPLDEAMAIVKSRSGTQFDPSVVQILETAYVELEVLARKQGETSKPLNTEVKVWRGAAPAAGFQQDSRSASSDDLSGSLDVPGDLQACRSEELPLPVFADNRTALAQDSAIDLIPEQESRDLHRDKEVMSRLSFRLRRLIPNQRFSIYKKTGDLLSISYTDGEIEDCFSSESIKIGEGVSGWVAQNGKPILNGNVQVESNYQTSGSGVKLTSALSIPLFDLLDNVFAVLTLYSVDMNSFSKDHLHALQAIESNVSLSLRSTSAFQSTESEAAEWVTNLPTVRQFILGVEAETNKAFRSEERFGVVVCSLDLLNGITELRGKPVANLLTQLIAEGFRKSSRSYDTVARMGEHIFLFLLPGVDGHNCSSKLEMIRGIVESTCIDLKIAPDLAASIGTAFYPEDGDIADELIDLAVRRMNVQRDKQWEKANRDAKDRSVHIAAVA